MKPIVKHCNELSLQAYMERLVDQTQLFMSNVHLSIEAENEYEWRMNVLAGQGYTQHRYSRGYNSQSFMNTPYIVIARTFAVDAAQSFSKQMFLNTQGWKR